MHSYEVDYYAIGIIAHEIMLGRVILFLFSGLILVAIGWRLEMPFCQNNT
jgi:hypothetical protein